MNYIRCKIPVYNRYPTINRVDTFKKITFLDPKKVNGFYAFVFEYVTLSPGSQGDASIIDQRSRISKKNRVHLSLTRVNRSQSRKLLFFLLKDSFKSKVRQNRIYGSLSGQRWTFSHRNWFALNNLHTHTTHDAGNTQITI